MKKYPSKIYLQIESYDGGIVTPDELLDCEVTWCQDRISKSDLVYYKKDYLKQSASVEKIYNILDMVIYRQFQFKNKLMNDDDIRNLAKEIHKLIGK